MKTTITKYLDSGRAALAKALTIKPADIKTILQAGFEARSVSTMPLNYNSVNTIDPARLASAFKMADLGYLIEQCAMYEMIEEQDAHIYSELAKRRRGVTEQGWLLEPREDAAQSELDRTKELHEMLRQNPKFDQHLYDVTDGIAKGFSALEIEWQTGTEWYPKALNWTPQRRFQIDRLTGEYLLLIDGVPTPLNQWGWIVHEHKAKSGYIEAAALFRVLGWTYAYKAYDVRDLQRFLELYGMPIRVGKYPAGIDVKSRKELLRAVRKLGNDGAGIIPNTMAIDFVQSQNGKAEEYMQVIEYWERKQSLAILGGTLTSQADGKTSTNALGVIHDKVRREIVLHDVKQIQPTIQNQLIVPVSILNGLFPLDRIPHFKYDTSEPVDQSALVDVFQKGAQLGLEIDLDWAHKALQIPRAAKDAKILTAPASTPQHPDPQPDKTEDDAKTALVKLVALASAAKSSPEADIIAAYSAQLATLCVPHEQALIQQISAIIAEAGDFDEAIKGMEALKANNDAWAKTIAQGMTAANLAARSTVPNKGD